MAILNRDDYFDRVHNIIGERSDDESVRFLEDMTDTYNSLEEQATTNESAEWERRYNELEAQWKKRYKDRFFSGRGGTPNTPDCGGGSHETEKPIGISDLFS